MTSASVTTLSSVYAAQTALLTLSTLEFTKFSFQPNCTLTNKTSYDYIVIGSGSAGSVLGKRLSENGSYSVLVLESGGYPPLESQMPGTFTVLPNTTYDYNTPSVNDNVTSQWLQDGVVRLTKGNMLGGSSSLNHMIHVTGNPVDYNDWATVVGDDRWNYTNVFPYIQKLEKLVDSDLLNSSYAQYHGTDGMMPITREKSCETTKYFEAFAELGHSIVDDITKTGVGYCEPLYNIYNDIRQSNGLCYLGLEKKSSSQCDASNNESNLCLALSTKATKILIEDNVAKGVQVITAGGETYVLYANKEVIVSAGSIHSPQLLMLSGIGPKEHLESFNIPVIADLPVGQNLSDHPSAVVVIQMESSNSTGPATNPGIFPTVSFTGYVAINKSQTYPDYQTINLLFPPASSGQMQLCTNGFKYNDTICDLFYSANTGRNILFVVHNVMKPKSYGKVLLSSSDISDDPLVYTGLLSNKDDIENMALYLEDFAQVMNTTYFLSVNATIVDPGMCAGLTGLDYWRCYAVAMSSTMWHYSGTCSMGNVLDSELKVKGVSGLRVVDASAMPITVSGNINAAVTLLAEVAAGIILGRS